MLYQLIIKQNRITKLQIEVPKLEKKLLLALEQEQEIEFRLNCYEDPAYLLKVAQKPDFQYLMLPGYHRIIDLKEGGQEKIVDRILQKGLDQ